MVFPTWNMCTTTVSITSFGYCAVAPEQKYDGGGGKGNWRERMLSCRLSVQSVCMQRSRIGGIGGGGGGGGLNPPPVPLPLLLHRLLQILSFIPGSILKGSFDSNFYILMYNQKKNYLRMCVWLSLKHNYLHIYIVRWMEGCLFFLQFRLLSFY